MTVKNLIDYTDRETKELQEKGAEREVTVRRGRELIKKGFVEEVKRPVQE